MNDDLSNVQLPENMSLAWAEFDRQKQVAAGNKIPGTDEVNELFDRALEPVIAGYTPVPGYDTSTGIELEADLAARIVYSREVVDGRRLEPEFLAELNHLAKRSQYGAVTVTMLVRSIQPNFNFQLFVDEPCAWPFTGATWRYVEPNAE